MSHASQTICKTSPSFSKSVGGNAAPSDVVLRKKWLVCGLCLPHCCSLLTCSSSPSATYPAAYSLVGQPFPHQPTLVAQQPQQPQQLQQREGKLKELCTDVEIHSNGFSCFSWFTTCHRYFTSQRTILQTVLLCFKKLTVVLLPFLVSVDFYSFLYDMKMY